jgi:hypothetical protein
MLLLDSTLLSLSFYVFAPVYGYLEWLHHQDARAAYRTYAWYLRWFQSANPEQRLTLKAPAHTGALTELLAAIPDARIVQTHRDPAEVVPSLNSLLYSLHSLASDRLDVRALAEQNMRHLEHTIERNESARAAGARIVDVHYDDLVRDPVGCVRRLYQDLGEELDDGHGQRLRDFVAHRPKNRFGDHVYSAEDFGTTTGALRERFAAYCARRLDSGRAA